MDYTKFYLSDIGFIFTPNVLDKLLYDKSSYLSYITKDILNIIVEYSGKHIIYDNKVEKEKIHKIIPNMQSRYLLYTIYGNGHEYKYISAKYR